MKSFKEYAQDKDIEAIKSILIEEGYDEPTQEQLVALLEAGFLQRLGQSKLGKAAKAATLAAAMAGAGMGQASANDGVGKSPFKAEPTISWASPQDVQMNADMGFAPHPTKKGTWIPAGGADAVHVKARTLVKNDRLDRDDIGLTPTKGGKPIGKTSWSHTGDKKSPFDNPYDGIAKSDGTITRQGNTVPFDGASLYQQIKSSK